jgi:hypothetical protein
MKSILALILSLTFAQSAMAVDQLECGFLHGLVTGAQGLGPTKINRRLNVDAWVGIYEITENKFRVFNEGILKNFNLLRSPNVRRGVEGATQTIQAIIDMPTRSGDANYWVSMVEIQEKQFTAVVTNLRLIRDAACERALTKEGL